jgi:hypothetical protein
MIGLGLRLTLNGGREAAIRLAVTAAAVALGVGMLLVTLAGPGAPVPPGISHLPGPGQFYASPALTQLLRSTPAAELGDRFPGHQIGTIGASALPAPNSLIIVIGHQAAQLSRAPGAGTTSSLRG